MKTNEVKRKRRQDEMLREYDFAGMEGIRGKYYKAYRAGHTVRVHKSNGSINVRYFTLKDGAVMLEADLRQYFPTDEAVNSALRSLVALIPTKSKRKVARKN